MKKGGGPPPKRKAVTLPAKNVLMKNMLEQAHENQKQLAEDYQKKAAPLVEAEEQLAKLDMIALREFKAVESDGEGEAHVNEMFAKVISAPEKEVQQQKSDRQEYGLEAEFNSNNDRSPDTAAAMSNILKDVRNKNFKLHAVGSTPIKKLDKTVDVTAAVQANPSAFGSSQAYMNLFKTDADNKLGTIMFSEAPILDANFYYWPEFKTVTTLDVSFCPNITDFGIRLISDAFPKLKKINVSGCRLVTEASLRHLSNQSLDVTFDMTSVRYVPSGLAFTRLQVRGCPLIVQGEGVEKSSSSSVSLESLQSVFSFAKVVIIKPEGVKVEPLGVEWLKPDQETTGPHFLTSYRSGPYRVIECTSEAPLQLFLTNNCLVVLPFIGNASDLAAEYKSVENRFNFVSSLITNFQALAVPIFPKTKSASADSLNETQIKLLKSEQVKAACQTSMTPSEKAKRTPESNPRMARLCHFLANNLTFLPTASTVSDWVSINRPHIGLPQSVLNIFGRLKKSNFLNDPGTLFQKIGSLPNILSNEIKPGLIQCWSSFVEILAETGNCWLESFTGWDAPSPSPSHYILSTGNLIKFVEMAASSKDSTAGGEDILCLAADTPLCSMDRIRTFLNGLHEEEANRLLREFELAGLGVFNEKRPTALAYANLPENPHIAPEHFLNQFNHQYQASETSYTVTCSPKLILPSLVSALSKVFQPLLLWKNGAIFQEAASFVIHVILEAKAIKVEVISENQNLIQGSLSMLKVICLQILQPFSTTEQPPDSDGMATHIPCKLDPETGDTIRTFTRDFDITKPRCMRCLLTTGVLAMLRRFYAATRMNKQKMIEKVPKSGENLTNLVTKLPLDTMVPFNFIEILTAKNLKVMTIYLNDFFPGAAASFIRMKVSETGDGHFAADFSINFSFVNLQGKPEIAKQGNNTVRLPDCPIRVDAFLREEQPESIAFIQVSAGGLVLAEANLKTNAFSSITHLTLVSEINANSFEKEVPFYIYTRFEQAETAKNDGNFSSSKIVKVKPGMMLEALSLKKDDGKLYPAVVEQVDEEKGQVLLKIFLRDEKNSKETEWFELDSPWLFPLGFALYLAESEILFDCFKRNVSSKLTVAISYEISNLAEQGSSPPDGFKGSMYDFFSSLVNAEKEPTIKYSLHLLPPNLLEKSHLLGYKCGDKSVCSESLSMKLWTALKRSLRDTVERGRQLEKLVHDGLIFLALPRSLTWQQIAWPSFSLTTVSGDIRPNFLCGGKGLLHFVNESPEEIRMPQTAQNAAPIHYFLAISKMIDQPHFIPDNFERLFPELKKKCPFNYSSFQGEEEGKRDKIERLFRNFVFPFLLDSYFLQISTNLVSEFAAKAGTAEYKKVVSLYEQFQRTGDTLTGDGTGNKKAKSDLVVMPWLSTHFDYYQSCSDCPFSMCVNHMYHCSAYEQRKRLLNYETDDEKLSAALEAVGKSYDSLQSTWVCTPENVSTPLAESHPYITDLYMGSCSLESVPNHLFKLRHLTELILRENDLTGLPDEFSTLAPTLQLLDISLNNFRELPGVIYELTELRSLRADFLSLLGLDNKIGNLKNLIMLSLRSNCLKTVPPGLAMLKKLQSLDLSGLPFFPLSLQYIEEVGTFMEKNNFPSDANALLTTWQPAGQTVRKFSPERNELLNEHMFANLPRLEGGSFPKEIFSLKSIRELSLANQPIVSVPDEIEGLTGLRRFDLGGCLQLKTISPRISTSPLEMLNLANCPLLSTPPAEIRKRGFAATTAFFRRLALGSVNVQRTKLMFVGLGGAGKTSLVNALTSETNKGVLPGGNVLPVTDGIDITDWEVPTEKGSKVCFRLWDFAGQVVYYNTHQFFLSNRAVYLIMWNIRLGHEHAGLEFWLSSIAVHAPQASVIVVGTHADQVSEERSFLPELSYRERFSAICGFHYVSSHTGLGIEALRQQILEVAMKQKHMGEAIPVAWLNFEQELTEKRRKKVRDKTGNSITESSILMLTDVVELADSSGIYEQDELDQALQFFTDLGSIQYFKTDFLRDRVIINPQWIVDVMASLVSVKDSPIENGKMFHKDLTKLWKDYDVSLHPWLLKLTEAFDLTFPLRNEPASIVPCMLPENAPADLNWPSLEDHPDWRQSELILQFKYLPTGLFNRAQVRLCQLSDAKIWRRGSLLHKNRHLALILQPDTASVHVKVQGPRPENISFFILEVFDTLINESFHSIQPEYLFACPECVNVRASQPSMFERSRIRRATELHIPTMQCFHYFHQIPTRELRQLLPAENAGDFDYQLSRTVQQLSGIAQSFEHDVVIVGNAKDLADEKNFTGASEISSDLEKSLSGMKIVLINDPDSISFDRISLLIRSSRLVICCLSPNFMSSDNCQAVLLCARETFRKPLLIVLVREVDMKANDSLTFFIGDQVYVKAINRTKYKPQDVAEAVKRRLNEAERVSSATRIKHPVVFISYCWQNSQDAVEKGTKPRDGSVGLTDPRALKKYLTEFGNFDCWLDVEQVGRNGLFEDIAVGLRHARVVIVCVSDEYVVSPNCIREFRFATNACACPVILCVVGTGMLWKTSEVSLVLPSSAPVINFQVDSKSNYEKLLNSVKNVVENGEKSDKNKSKPTSLANIGRMKTMDDIKAANSGGKSQPSSQEAMTAVFQEMRELEQRRFLRQVAGFAETAAIKPYPRLVFLDIEGNSLQIKTPSSSEEPSSQQDVDFFNKFQWSARFLCEHEEGWHMTETKFLLSPENASQFVQKSAPYLGRVFSLLKHSANNAAQPQILAPKDVSLETLCEMALRQIEKFVKFEESFEVEYANLLSTAISLDQHASFGGLQRCQLAIGKVLWLCSQHQSLSQYRMKGTAGGGNELKTEVGDLSSEADRSLGMLGVSLVLEHKPINREKTAIQPKSAGKSQSGETKRSVETKTSRACLLQ